MPEKTPSEKIAECTGPEAFLRLVESYGGTRVRVHAIPRPESPLALCLGPEAYARLQSLYAAEYISIPLLHTSHEHRLASSVITAIATGDTVTTVARRHHIPIRRVYRILARHRAASPAE